MSQTKAGSLTEAMLNTLSGLFISFAVGLVIYPAFGHAFTIAQNVGITGTFTVLSIARSYIWRRVFVRWIRG